MNGILGIVLIVTTVITAFFLLRKIRKSQLLIDDAIFWIIFCFILIFLAIFPKVSYWLSTLLGFESPVNFIFIVFIFLLLIKVFSLSNKISKLENQIQHLVQKYAIDYKDKK